MAERQFGPYRLVRQIAVGGMAEIHLAKTKGIAGFEKYVALKMIHPNFAEDEQFIQMLVDEAKIAVQLNHGNIAQTFDLGRVGDTFYITMEFVDGADLYKILRRGSEADIEMPLDVCAFVGKEVASALDHAHRKRDHVGKSLGIVHRDVSPQNVLISYAGEVKIVDFGIAKATMKARQTAAGVIKGKYYYMSPEQAWGDPIDFRSDIFSAGIVLYEMITGQMLYLEEDLNKLLELARAADIAPPSTLRPGIPSQLERILMHALAKRPEDRYQSAGELAADLERFLHAYSPVFTATRLAALMKQILGNPDHPSDSTIELELRDGKLSSVNPEELILAKEEIRDENSVIFRVADLEPQPLPQAPARVPGSPAGRITRQANIDDVALARSPLSPGNRPAQVPEAGPTPPTGAPRVQPTPPRAQPVVAAQRTSAPAAPIIAGAYQAPAAPRPPRQADDKTRDIQPLSTRPAVSTGWSHQEQDETVSGHGGHDLDNIGDRTMVSSAPGMPNGGFLVDTGGEDGVEATMITGAPQAADTEDTLAGQDDLEGETLAGSRRAHSDRLPAPSSTSDDDADALSAADDDGPTIPRHTFTAAANPRTASQRGSAPPALAAKIHAPAVSELRKPRTSRRTPSTGLPQDSVLQRLVGAQASEPMPAPMPSRSNRNDDSNALTLPGAPTGIANAPAHPYVTDASGMPLGPPPHGAATFQPTQQPPHPGYPPPLSQQPGSPYGAVLPAAHYPQPMSLTNQMRMFEADEIPSQYKVSRPTWLKIVIINVIAIAVAGVGAFLVVRHLRDEPPTIGSIHIESAPAGAEVYWDNSKLDKKTPVTVDGVPVGSRHEIRVQLQGHTTYTESVLLPKKGGEVPVTAILKVIAGKIRVVTHPDGAEIWIDGELRGRAPTTLNDIDLTSAKQIELRLKEYQPYIQPLTWPTNGEIDLDIKLTK